MTMATLTVPHRETFHILTIVHIVAHLIDTYAKDFYIKYICQKFTPQQPICSSYEIKSILVHNL